MFNNDTQRHANEGAQQIAVCSDKQFLRIGLFIIHQSAIKVCDVTNLINFGDFRASCPQCLQSFVTLEPGKILNQTKTPN